MRMLLAMGLVVGLLTGAAAAPPLQHLSGVPISVRVVDAKGQPLTGGVVNLNQSWAGQVQQGWAKGVVAQVTPGIRHIAYVREGVVAAREVSIREHDTKIGATIRVGAEPVADGCVVATDGRPVSYANLYVVRGVGDATADARGRFRIDGRCLEGSTVAARPPGFVPSAGGWVLPPFPARLRLVVAREATLQVAVTSADGIILGNARCGACPVTLGPSRIRWGGAPKAQGEQGVLEIRGLPPGKVKVAATAHGYEIQAKELEVAEGQLLPGLQFRLQPLPIVSIEGIVVGPDGQTPIPHAWVYLSEDPWQDAEFGLALAGDPRAGDRESFRTVEPRTAEADDNGQFEFRTLAGRYTVSASAPGYGAERPYQQIDARGPVSSLRVRLVPLDKLYGQVRLTVRMPDGSMPPKGATISMRSGEGAQAWYESSSLSETGVYSRSVPPGPARLTVTFPFYAGATAEFVVAAGQTVEPVLRFLPEAWIAGKVVDGRNGKPVAMATVEAGPPFGAPVSTATDDDGTCRLPPCTAGQTVLTVSRPGYAASRRKVDTSSGGVHRVTVAVSPGGRLWGRLSGAWLTSGMRPAYVQFRRENDRGFWTLIDEAGAFVEPHLAPGSYTLSLDSAGASTPLGKPVTVTLAEGKTSHVVIEPR